MSPRRETRNYKGKYLINETPVSFQPTLAQMLGTNEAILLQQVHFWINNPFAFIAHDDEPPEYLLVKKHEGRLYVRIKPRQMLHPLNGRLKFFSERTLKRTIAELRTRSLLLTENLNDDSWDQTNWYAIDYEHLETMEEEFEEEMRQTAEMEHNRARGQNGPMHGATAGTSHSDPAEGADMAPALGHNDTMDNAISDPSLGTEKTKYELRITSTSDVVADPFDSLWNTLATETQQALDSKARQRLGGAAADPALLREARRQVFNEMLRGESVTDA